MASSAARTCGAVASGIGMCGAAAEGASACGAAVCGADACGAVACPECTHTVPGILYIPPTETGG